MTVKGLVVVVSLGLPAVAAPQSFVAEEIARLKASASAAKAGFGSAVSVSENTVLVGAADDDAKGPKSGAAFVFAFDGDQESEEIRLSPDDGAAGDGFGTAAALRGELAVVGAPFDDDHKPNSGSVYVFQRNGSTWLQLAKLTASDAAQSGWFGQSVSMSANRILVGAPGNKANVPNAGAAYVFERNANTWTQTAKLSAGDASEGAMFGVSVSISGGRALVGAQLDDEVGTNSGSAYVFELTGGGVWTEVAKLNASDGDDTDFFGCAVALTRDTALVGARLDDVSFKNSGSAYVFERDGSAWSEQAKLTASDPDHDAEFGSTLALEGDVAVVGAKLDQHSNDSVGGAYLFTRSGSAWPQGAKLRGSREPVNDEFGGAVSLSGNQVAVGARRAELGAGAAYLFEFRSADYCPTTQAKLARRDSGQEDRLGTAVVISRDTAVLGSPFDDDAGMSSGSAHVFVRDPTNWRHEQKLTASDAVARAEFGSAVSIREDTILIGAPRDWSDPGPGSV